MVYNINSACIHSLGGFDIKGQKQLDESLSLEHDPESIFGIWYIQLLKFINWLPRIGQH